MFGFLKRLFGGAARRETKQDVPPIAVVTPPPAPPPVALPVQPVFAAPVSPVFAPPTAQPVATLVMEEEEPSALGMVQSVSNPEAYMIGLVGEADHAAAVADLREGSPIWLELEADNPQDNSAIAAVDQHGRVIGYIASDSWLREAIYGSGASFAARVLATEMGTRGFREVVLEVEASEEPLRERRYQPPALV